MTTIKELNKHHVVFCILFKGKVAFVYEHL